MDHKSTGNHISYRIPGDMGGLVFLLQYYQLNYIDWRDIFRSNDLRDVLEGIRCSGGGPLVLPPLLCPSSSYIISEYKISSKIG